MTVQLFILGLPGSGKSTIARYIVDYVQKQRRSWSTSRLNDYAILREMFLADSKHEKFKPTEGHDGFDILDLSQLNLALKELEKRATRASDKADLILVEFARNEYSYAFAQFTPDFVQDAYILYLKVKIRICKQRIRDRVADPHTEDDHYLSEYIFGSYYDKDSSQQLYSGLNTEYSLAKQKIRLIDNNGQFEDIVVMINEFIDFIFEQEGGNMLAPRP